MLEGKVAIVTGAGRGLGRAHALALAAAGAQVIVNDLGGNTDGEGMDAGPAQDVTDEITAAGGTALADAADISNWSEAAGLIERTVGRFGRLDILVNNAGICRPTAFGDLTEQVWDRMVDVNAKSMAALIDAAARHWREAGPSRDRAVVCTASPSGAEPHEPLGVYSVTKAAVAAIAQVAAAELASLGVRVNALAPTGRTRMVAAAMVGSQIDIDQIMPRDPEYDLYLPDHVARLVLYLVSPLCPFTGRLFGVRADDIFVYDSWNATHHLSNGGTAWTTEELATAMKATPLQQDKRIVAPMGRMAIKSPGDEVLAQLRTVDR